MDAVPGLKQLQERKRDLLLESDLNRQVLRLELAKLRLRGQQIRSGVASGQGWWKLAAPIAGFLVARRFSKGSSLVTKGSLIVSALGAAWKLWSNRKKPTAADTPDI